MRNKLGGDGGVSRDDFREDTTCCPERSMVSIVVRIYSGGMTNSIPSVNGQTSNRMISL